MTKIAQLKEKEIIERYFKRGSEIPEDVCGIGDDCAAYKCSQKATEWQLVTTDALVEDTHFRLDRIDPRDLGYKAAAVNLSDIAAMGGTPGGFYVSIALPDHLESEWLKDLSDGIFELCDKYDIPILGGDTTSSKKGVYLSLTVSGSVEDQNIKYRHGGQPGDILFVTGPLGDSAAGLLLELEEGLDEQVSKSVAQKLRKRHYRPPATLEMGQWLGRQQGVRAMMDLSDGLTSDLPEVINHNNLGANVIREQIPLTEELKSFTSDTRYSAYQLAEDGGEDYQLLFAADPEKEDQIKRDFKDQFEKSLYAVGELTDEHSDLLIYQNGQQVRKNPSGFHHFS